jgi:hypothetical protein
VESRQRNYKQEQRLQRAGLSYLSRIEKAQGQKHLVRTGTFVAPWQKAVIINTRSFVASQGLKKAAGCTV